MADLKQIDAVLQTAAARGDVPGVVAAAAAREGRSYTGAFGTRVLPDGAPMTADSVFWIASMTKAITSAAALQLVEQGKLTVDGPIGDVLRHGSRFEPNGFASLLCRRVRSGSSLRSRTDPSLLAMA